jgi:hypothetical protein
MMTSSDMRVALCGLLLALASGEAAADDTARSRVDFDRQIRPILAEKCFKCHGPDEAERESGLRLDVRDEALRPADSGRPAIVPGKPEESPLVRRILSRRKGVRMPPPESNKTLTDAEKELLRSWVVQGAEYRQHWSFIPPRRSVLPAARDAGWCRNPIDRFVLARLDAEQLSASREADRTTLIRRLSLDLTGLPPTPADVATFLADKRPEAYESLVDRLLASPRFGERLALDWLDAARYADTHGFHIDSGREMTRWRAWVIEAFNRNLPFDRFTIEQLAGDLLPDATLDQKIASGFHRNHMINFEGGAVPEEYQTAYVVDRVNTTATVWLGLTMACAQCHDHKFDPITQKDYYSLYAVFNNVPEQGLDGSKGNAVPYLALPTRDQRRDLDQLAAAVGGLEPSVAQGDSWVPVVNDGLAELRKARELLERQVPTTMVMQELPQPRETFMLVRGQYDKKGEKVAPGVPAFLPPMPAGASADRLGVARWLVDPAQPLTARVAVNRYWQMVFGTGLVKTAEDLGSQGEPPSHPDLLDWLAVEFAEGGWDVKRLFRLIVTSATYRQSSAGTPDRLAKDPENRLFSRGPRCRLQAELLRDQALAVSGLLRDSIGGRSVSPYQPAGLWEELMSREDGANWTAQKYVQDHGDDLYRRSMYTFWKRTSPPPSLATFDAPDRETCTVRRARTNTPLQALVLLNDPTYVEASRKLAERLMVEATTVNDRIELAFELATARRPSDLERGVLAELFDSELAAFRKDRDAALKLLAIGEAPGNRSLDPAELAAWAVVASAVLNLDEVVTKG